MRLRLCPSVRDACARVWCEERERERERQTTSSSFFFMRIHVPRRFLGKTHTSRLYKYKRYMSTHPKVAKNSPRSDAFTILF